MHWGLDTEGGHTIKRRTSSYSLRVAAATECTGIVTASAAVSSVREQQQQMASRQASTRPSKEPQIRKTGTEEEGGREGGGREGGLGIGDEMMR